MFVEDLIELLQEGGGNVPKVFGIDVFRGPLAVIPAGDGPFLSIVEILGLPPEGTHNAAGDGFAAYINPSAQMLFRAAVYDDARIAAQAVWDLLQPIRNRFVNGTWWRQVEMASEVIDLLPDKDGRARVSFNIDVIKRTSPTTSL